MAATIARVGIAVPPRVVTQPDAKAAARMIFRELPGIEGLLSVFDHAGVERRHFCFGPEYYAEAHGWKRRNDDYIANAVELSASACRAAGVEAGGIDHVIFVTTTGLATPSIDARLANRIGLRSDVRRTPLYGVGCAGGAVGLARAYDYLRGWPEHRVLLVSVELCGQTFDPTDRSKSNFVAAAIFGEGAAAVVLGGKGPGPRIVDAASLLLPDTLDAMGWEFGDSGPKLVLSKSIPGLIREHVGPAVRSFLARNGLAVEAVGHHIVHPGGPRVLDAIEGALELKNGALDPARRLLRDYGNLSSASVLFELADVLPSIRPGEHALALAVGPGFSLETVLLRA